MANKPILEIPLDKLQAFTNLFAKYQDSLKKLPPTYMAQDKAIEATAKKFGTYNAALLAQAGYVLDTNKQFEKQRQILEHISRVTKDIGRSTVGFVRDIERGLVGFAKWTGIGALATGGSLFGIDKLAQSVVAGRALALGTGSSYGGIQAARVGFGQYLDPGALAQAIGQVTAQGYGLPLIGGEVQGLARQGMTTDQIIPWLVRQGVERFRANPTQVGLTISGLDRFFSLEQLRELSALPQGELEGVIGGMGRNAGRFNLVPDVQQKWASLERTLGETARVVETDLVKALVNAAPQIERFARLIQQIADDLAPKIGPWIDKVTNWIARVSGEQPAAAGGAAEGPDIVQRLIMRGRAKIGAANVGDTPVNNPLGLRPAGDPRHFMQFPTADEGIDAAARQLRLYYDRDKLDTVQAIIAKWAPRSENDTAAYIRDVVQRTGYTATQHLNLDDPTVLGRLMAAMAKHENTGGIYGGEPHSTSKTTTIVLQNKAGGSIPLVAGQVAVSP